MNIADNILKDALKNVLFLSGTACGGKTTMSRLLAEKHGFLLYDMDQQYERFRAVARPDYQPDMCYHMQDFHQQWTRPAEEQARWNRSMMAEQVPMALLDLIRLSQNQRVVADVAFSPVYSDILDYHQIALLTVDRRVIRQSYFNRPEKRGFYEFVAKQPLAETYFENLFQGLELTNDLDQAQMKASGFLVHQRAQTDTPESVLALLEAHFRL